MSEEKQQFNDLGEENITETENQNDAVLQETDIKETSEKNGESLKDFVFDWIEVLVHAIIVVVICFSFIFRIATIDGPSMMNTLIDGERVIITNLFYEPKAGDIVVISRNKENSTQTMNASNTPIIKRIIATEGQTVNIDFDAGIVYVDGVALDEPYTRTPTNRFYDIKFPVTVDEGCVFVLGDNRKDSIDSRDSSIGMIDTRYILGHAVFRVFPLNKMGKIDE
ncbi:MAG: signal peptidase I [Clostridia bacterium]|nr:signal peptidase I [Clostridia bacterium]